MLNIIFKCIVLIRRAKKKKSAEDVSKDIFYLLIMNALSVKRFTLFLNKPKVLFVTFKKYQMGDGFDKRKKANEEEFFYKKEKEAMEKIKDRLKNSIKFHEDEIKRHQDELEKDKDTQDELAGKNKECQ